MPLVVAFELCSVSSASLDSALIAHSSSSSSHDNNQLLLI